jgi:hypothetical protein
MDTVTPAAGGEATHVFVFHDDCIVAQNEKSSSYWGAAGSQDRCFAKPKGKPLMLSRFICHCHGISSVQTNNLEAATATPASEPTMIGGFGCR